MKSLYSELGKMIVHHNKLPHPSLSQSQWDNASTYLFPFVSMDTWKNTDFQFLFFSLSLLFFPFPYLLSIFFPFFLAIDNTKVFFFSWRLFKHKPSLWENTNCKIRRKTKTSIWASDYSTVETSDEPQEFLSPSSLSSYLLRAF